MTLDHALLLARNLPLDKAAELVCATMLANMAELTARHDTNGRRKLKTARDLPKLRAAVWWHLRQVTNGDGPKWSYPEIAAVFKTGHSTVIEGVRRHERTGAK